MSFAETDSEAQSWAMAFTLRLQKLGWTDGRNLRIDYCWAPGNVAQLQANAAEIVSMMPDVILSAGASGVDELAG